MDCELSKLIDVMPGKDVARPRVRKRLASRTGECLSQPSAIHLNAWYCVNKKNSGTFLSQTNPTRSTWCPEQRWHYLLSDHVGGLSRVVALADAVADLLAVHDEVDAVGGQDQEAVVCVVQLQQRHTGCTAMRECCKARELPPCFHTLEKHFFFWIFPEAEDFKEDMIALQSSP